MIIKKKSLERVLGQKENPEGEKDQTKKAENYQLTLEQIESKIEEFEKKKQNLIQDSEEEAKKILEQASTEASEIINNSEREAEQILSSSKNFLAKIEEEFHRSISELLKTKENFLIESEPTIISLAVELAKKIIRYEIAREPQILKNLMLEALKEISLDPGQRSKLSFIVNPKNEQIAKSYIKEFEQKHENQIQIFINTDLEIEEGSCVLESPFGTVDLNFSSQIDLFKLKIAQN